MRRENAGLRGALIGGPTSEAETKLAHVALTESAATHKNLDPVDYTQCEKRFAELNTPAEICAILIEARKKRELKRKKTGKRSESAVAATVEDMTNSLEEELLALSDQAMVTAEGQGEIIVFNPEEIVDPFGDLLKEGEEPARRISRRKYSS